MDALLLGHPRRFGLALGLHLPLLFKLALPGNLRLALLLCKQGLALGLGLALSLGLPGSFCSTSLGKTLLLCPGSSLLCRDLSSLLPFGLFVGVMLLPSGVTCAHGQTPMLRPVPAVVPTEPGVIFRLSRSFFLGFGGSVVIGLAGVTWAVFTP